MKRSRPHVSWRVIGTAPVLFLRSLPVQGQSPADVALPNGAVVLKIVKVRSDLPSARLREVEPYLAGIIKLTLASYPWLNASVIDDNPWTTDASCSTLLTANVSRGGLSSYILEIILSEAGDKLLLSLHLRQAPECQLVLTNRAVLDNSGLVRSVELLANGLAQDLKRRTLPLANKRLVDVAML